MTRFIALAFLWLPIAAIAQDYNYLHLSIQDGLPSPTVYTCVQDTIGFIWFGTDNGLVRYDGYNFKYYTTSNGLPDNEVLQLWVDSKNRLWISCYNSPICFLENGLIQNSSNCDLLKNAQKAFSYASFVEDSKHQLWLTGNSHTIKINEQDVTQIDVPGRDGAPLTKVFMRNNQVYLLIENRVYDLSTEPPTEIARHEPDQRQLDYGKVEYFDQYMYLFTHRKLVFINTLYLPDHYKSHHEATMSSGVSAITKVGDNRLVVCMQNGFVFTDQLLNPVSDILLNDINISGCYQDREQNLWLTTFGDGIYLLPANKCISFNFTSKENYGAVTVINSMNDSLLIAGTEKGQLFILNNNSIINELDAITKTDGYKKIINVVPYNESVIVAANNGIYQITLNNRIIRTRNTAPIKTFSYFNNSLFFAGFSGAAAYFDPVTNDLDTLITGRVIVSHFDQTKRLWFASLDSLYVTENSLTKAVEWYQLDKYSRLSSITSLSDNTLVVGTYNNGILIRSNESNLLINTTNGLISNLCRYVYADMNDHIWVCTTNGLSEIKYDIHSKKVELIRNYSQTDGLLSNSIYSVCVLDSIVYIGTDAGISLLPYGRYSSPEIIPIAITSFNGDQSNLTGISKFDHTQNDIRIEYSGISFHTVEPLFFTYRLLGSADGWDTTYQKGINYSNLRPGTYTFQIIAHDSRGNKSLYPAVVTFEIVPALWQTLLFKILMGFIAILIIYTIVNHRSKSIRKKEIAKHDVEKQITELKLMAIRSQMNPHFIFNALNSIQHFNIVHNFDMAQKYLSDFSKLVRKTLDFSTKDFIPLSDEISFLENYLTLEHMRFEGRFQYEIILHPAVPPETKLPSQIIQPYVENAILHGIQNLKDEKGLLEIKFTMQGQSLICTIDDNGIGINKGRSKPGQKSHESKGLNLSAARIQAINGLYQMNMSVLIKDKEESDHEKHGTIVTIQIPINPRML